MDSVSVHLAAYDVLEAALEAGSIEAALQPMRAELEVLGREDLMRVAMAMAVETMLMLPPRGDSTRLQEKLQRRRLMAMVGPL